MGRASSGEGAVLAVFAGAQSAEESLTGGVSGPESVKVIVTPALLVPPESVAVSVRLTVAVEPVRKGPVASVVSVVEQGLTAEFLATSLQALAVLLLSVSPG